MRRARAFPPVIAVGVRVGADPSDDADHFYKCEECGHTVDCRSLGEVFEHEGEHLAPTPT